MGLDIWFAEDIRNALLAANEASAATAAVIAKVGSGPSTGSGQAVTDSTGLLAVTLRAYREGYKAALATVALAFGIAPQVITLRPLDGLGTIQAQDRTLRQAQDRTLQPFGCARDAALRVEPEGEISQPLQTPGSGEEL